MVVRVYIYIYVYIDIYRYIYNIYVKRLTTTSFCIETEPSSIR